MAIRNRTIDTLQRGQSGNVSPNGNHFCRASIAERCCNQSGQSNTVNFQ
jgi:hypothetical protein